MRSGRRQSAEGAAGRKIRTAFSRTGERRFSGFAVDPDDLGRRFTVEIFVDGYPVRVIRADAYVRQLAQTGVGDGCYGFSVLLDARVVNESAVVAARLANHGAAVGDAVILDRPGRPSAEPDGPGAVNWLGSLRFSGWLGDDQDPSTINVLVDGILVDRVRIGRWTHIGSGDTARAVRGFEVFLPSRFGDGVLHQFATVTATGENLAGSPITFAAFADGLRDFVVAQGGPGQEGLRAELFDQLVPQSVPFTSYAEWRQRFPIVAGAAARSPIGVVMVGHGALDDTLKSLQQQIRADWVAAALPGGRGATGFRRELVQEFLQGEGAGCEFMLFGLAGTVLAPAALQRIAQAFSTSETARAVYGDLDIKGADGSVWPLAFPAFDYERMLEQGYCAHLFALPAEIAAQALAAGAADIYRLFNAALDDGGASAGDVVHVPGSLGILPPFDRAAAGPTLAAASRAHLLKRGVTARVKATTGSVLPAARVSRTLDSPSVSIIIPTRDRHALLETCIESIRPALKGRHAEVIVVDNDSAEPAALDYLAKIDGRVAKVLRVGGSFNFARLNNRAVKAARGDLVCLLNNDVKALDDGWLDEMLSRVAAPDIGAVGAALIWPSGVIQHGGVVLGTSFAAAHAFNDRVDGDPGYADMLRVAHECSAVTAACLLTRRSDYIDFGGMDEVRFPVNFNDVDYCLKLRSGGRRIVFTPHAKLLHVESASRGRDLAPDRRGRFEGELRNLRSKWGAVLAADPYYSPLLARDPTPFSALAWPPGPMEPRVNRPLAAARVPPGF